MRAVLGVDLTLVGLQEGLTRDTVVVRGIEGQVRQCTNCSWTDRTDGSVCAACGGARLLTGLRAVLPQLAKRYKYRWKWLLTTPAAGFAKRAESAPC